MRNVSVSELKANLSRYLRAVRRGGEVEILDRGIPIARLVGLRGGQDGVDGRDAQRLDLLTRAGILRRGTGNLGWVLKEPLVSAPGANLLTALDEDRKDRL